ncbi:MAG TPA: GAF domain-containing protein [Anaerolineae bacterium]|nr:GAF domain-containing protein [Anaerolineae bacterium]HQI83946.1 GAF domain-containing protein [Anaerolineae bacterium]
MSQKGMSLRWRMILIIAGIPMVLLIPVFIYVSNQYRNAYRQAYLGKAELITIQLQQTLETVAPYVETFQDAPGLATLLQKVVEGSPEFDFVALVDNAGKVIEHSTPGLKNVTVAELAGLDSVRPIELRELAYFGSVYLISRAVPMPGDVNQRLYIVVGERAEVVDPSMTALLIAGILSGLGLIALLYFSTQGLVLRPLTRLAEGARIIGGGDLTHTIPVDREDEIGVVAQSFNGMADRLRDMVSGLEHRITERTAALERKSLQLETISLVSKEAAQVRNVILLLETTVQAISEKFGFYHVGIFILDDARVWAILRAASSEGGRRMLARGHRLRVGQTGIVGFVAGVGKPRIVFNVGEDTVWFNNPDLPDTRSEMALPLLVESGVIGVLDVQSDVPKAFTDEDISTLQLLADQLAVALNNARALEQMESALAEVHNLQVEYSRQGWARIAAQTRPLAYEYDRVDVNPVPPLPVPPDLREGRVKRAELIDGGVPVVMETLRAGDRVLGYLGLADSQRTWSPEELALVESVSEQVALALENARLFEESQQSQRQQTLISNVLQVSSNPDLSFEEVLAEIARILAQALGMAVGIYTFPTPNFPRVQPHAVLDPFGVRLPLPAEPLALSDEHFTFFRGLRRAELGPLLPLLGGVELAPESRDLLSPYELKRVFYVPLGSSGSQHGFIVMLQSRDNALPLDPETRDLIQRLANQIEVVLDNLTLTEETQQRSEELRSLYNISLVLSELLEPADVLAAIVAQGETFLNADSSGFFEYDVETDELILALGPPDGSMGQIGLRLRRGEGLAGEALAKQQTLYVEDYEVWEKSVPALRSSRFHAIMAVPLIGRFGPQGVLILRAEEIAAFGDREVRLANLFAQQAAAAFDNARLNKDAQRRAEEFSLLSQAGIDLLPIRDMEQLLARAADWTRRIFDVPHAVIYLRDADTGVFVSGHSADGAAHVLAERADSQPSSGGLTEEIMQTRKSVFVQDTRVDGRASNRRLADIGLLSRMGVPLRVGEDILGAVLVAGSEANQFNERELNLLEFLATQVSSAIQNALQFGRTEAALRVVRRQARYQANVSQAAALLTERGTEAVADVLRLLGEASNAQGVLYLEYHAAEDDVAADDGTEGVGGDSHWQSRAMWMAEELPAGQFDVALLRHISLERMQPWADQLIGTPYLALQPDTFPDMERELMHALGFNTLLVLTVRGEALYPNIILLGRADADNVWLEEEIVAMQTAAATLSNTIARERVFQEVQASRTETEALYRGSAELNLAQTYDGILNVLRTHTILGQGAHHMTLQLFDRPWTDEDEPQYAEVVAHWTTTGTSALRQRYWVADFPTSRELVHNAGVILLDDLEHNPLLSRRNRALFSRVYGAKAVVLVPLIASGQRIGFLHAMYPQAVTFSEQERRRLESLTQQAAIAAQNRLQLLTIEARVNRERMIREITERIQAAPDVQGVLQAAVRELGRAFGTSRNRIQFRPPAESTDVKTNGAKEP